MGRPLACFLTTTAYGTRLPGDERGSVDLEHNAYGEPYCPPTVRRVRANASQLSQAPVKFNAAMRAVIEEAIVDACNSEVGIYGRSTCERTMCTP